MSETGKVRLRSDGINDTWLELDGKRLNLPITRVEFEHRGGNPPSLPTLIIELECVQADVFAKMPETEVEIVRTLIDYGAVVRG